MKLKAIIRFNDLQAGVIREAGDEFEADKERAQSLIQKGFAEAVPVEAEPEKAAPKRKKKQ